MSSNLKFTERALIEFRKSARQYKNISDHICRMVIYEEISYAEPVMVEVSRVGINSFIFKEYLDKIIGFVQPDVDGTVELTNEEVTNIFKCIKALADSKVKLLESSVSLELH